MRAYLDREGTEWTVWKVQPHLPLYRERRRAGRAEGYAGEERRRGDLQQGWLCFERGGERWRLYPIPAEWESCSETRLDLYRRMAVPSARLRPAGGG
jgi:hypothetical protein